MGETATEHLGKDIIYKCQSLEISAAPSKLRQLSSRATA